MEGGWGKIAPEKGGGCCARLESVPFEDESKHPSESVAPVTTEPLPAQVAPPSHHLFPQPSLPSCYEAVIAREERATILSTRYSESSSSSSRSSPVSSHSSSTAQEANRNNENGGGNGNSNEARNRDEVNGGSGGVAPVARACTYKDFLNCQPRNFSGTERVLGLARWFEKMESVFRISNCVISSQVKLATYTLLDGALTWWSSHVQTIGIDEAL
ncbi:hypothetical protein Tco_0428132 [Tanacetum coccineum]